MAAIRYDVDPLLNKTRELLSKLPPIVRYEAEAAPKIETDKLRDKKFTVKVVDGVYIVEGKWIANIMRSVNFNDYESLQYFQRVLVDSGIIKELKKQVSRRATPFRSTIWTLIMWNKVKIWEDCSWTAATPLSSVR